MVQMGVLHASLALARASLNRPESVLKSVRLAFLDAFESNSFRTTQFTFEIVAATLATLGDPSFARALADWTETWRNQTEAPRSEAERLLNAQIPTPTHAPGINGDPATIAKQTMKRLRALVTRA